MCINMLSVPSFEKGYETLPRIDDLNLSLKMF